MNNIANYLSSNGRKTSHVTIGAYVDSLEESYLYHKVERINVSDKSLLKTNYKYYMVDLGFRKYIFPKQKYDVGFSLENVVYFELLSKVNIGKINDKEVDFVAFKDGIYEYYQVTLTMLEESTFNREIEPLKAIKDNYPKYVITNDYIGLGNYNGINIVNIIDWLLK